MNLLDQQQNWYTKNYFKPSKHILKCKIYKAILILINFIKLII